MLKDLFWRTIFSDLTVMEEYHAISHPLGKAHFVGNDDHGHPFFGQVLHNTQHVTNHFRLSLKRLMVILARTMVNLRKTVVTICSLIALASVMNYSGMITAIASGLVAVTGDYYPLVAPMIGAIGTFVTGSDTSSNILFAKLQAHVANQLGMTGQSTFFGMEGGQENWLVAANTTGATGGKMISPQSIAIATAACDMEGKDGEILRSAIPYALLYIVLGGLMVYFGC